LQYAKVCLLFSEDPKKVAPDEFFGTFDQFLSSLEGAGDQNRRRRMKAEEEAKRKNMEAKVCVNNLQYNYYRELKDNLAQ